MVAAESFSPGRISCFDGALVVRVVEIDGLFRAVVLLVFNAKAPRWLNPFRGVNLVTYRALLRLIGPLASAFGPMLTSLRSFSTAWITRFRTCDGHLHNNGALAGVGLEKRSLGYSRAAPQDWGDCWWGD